MQTLTMLGNQDEIFTLEDTALTPAPNVCLNEFVTVLRRICEGLFRHVPILHFTVLRK